MPALQFRCECGNEFEKIVTNKHTISKWCKHCSSLTVWEEIKDTHDRYYKETVCSRCLGNEHKPPLETPLAPPPQENTEAECPACGKMAPHILVAKFSCRFNYMEPT